MGVGRQRADASGGDFGQNQTAGTTRRDVGALGDAGNDAAVTDDDFAAKGASWEGVEAQRIAKVSGVDDGRRAVADRDASTLDVERRGCIATAHVDHGVQVRQVVRVSADGRHPRQVSRRAKGSKAIAGVAGRGGDKDSRIAHRQPLQSEGAVPRIGRRAGRADGIVDCIHAVDDDLVSGR